MARVVVSCRVLLNPNGVVGSLVFPKLPAHVLHLALHLEGPWSLGQCLMLAIFLRTNNHGHLPIDHIHPRRGTPVLDLDLS